MSHPTSAEQRVLERIDEQLIIDLTCALVQAPSVNPGGTEADAVAVLADAARGVGLEVDVYDVSPQRPNLIATYRGGPEPRSIGPGLMFLGHSDVVPTGPGWTGDPFVARQLEQRIIGRGAADMKGGLAAIIAAQAALIGENLSGPVQLVCTVDEEERGTGVRELVRRGGTGGGFLGCVVAEPTQLQTVIACRGASYIEVEVTGRAAHSGRPADGRSAIDAAARIIEIIRTDHDTMQQHLDPWLGAGTWNVGTIVGGQGISAVAPSCSLGIDRRLMPDEDAEAIAAWLRTQVQAAGIDTDGIAVDVAMTMQMPGFRTDRDHPLVTASMQAVSAVGVTPSVGGWTAACDGGFVSRDLGIDCIVLGPGDINTQAHQPDESVAITELVAAAQIYALLALRLLGRG
ncbi:M20 family metallopeptidase [Williamsia sp. CHRR-6]|uniref:M20 family metallopeptidase n=1 Tax=Williamsia sp. CHRR-6 TaxID=2835871 RepID=UPI001BD92B98|nr:M20 family metallopeptidase [Williamsia sp. CHRR-6]MBT0566219.1 M20 family metallopeptidase [Williamsia sp. CHRR-6]